MTTTLSWSTTNWGEGTESETTVVIKQRDLRELLSGVKVLAMQLEKYNEMTEKCLAEVGDKPGADHGRMLLMIGQITVKIATTTRERIMKTMGIAETEEP